MTGRNGGSDGEDAKGRPPRDTIAKPQVQRFYAAVTVTPHAGGFAVALDGRPARTPAKRVLAVASEALATALAAEWAAQSERIDPARMPLTRIANTALDGVAERTADVAVDIVKYAASDLLCYRAEAPAELCARQAAAWDPLLDWAAEQLGLRLVCSSGVMPVAQSGAALAAASSVVVGLDPLRLASVHVLTTLLGSAVLALAVLKRRLTPEAAWSAAHVDEDWQAEQWGTDEEAAARRARRWVECQAAARVLELLG